MSRSQNLLTAVVVVGLGVISGRYIFRPAIEDLEKEKRVELLEKSTHQPALPENGEEALTSDKKIIKKVDHKSCLTEPDKKSKDNSASKDVSKSWSYQRLPSYLQPWDARKR
ncbi:MAG: hypothetical protein Q9204_004864 [Flavoplaca sp. TL-2023a]